MTAELRELTIAEWLGERRQEYEKFVSRDDSRTGKKLGGFDNAGYFAATSII